MATFLDIAFLEKFSSIFIVLFVFTLLYAVLMFKGVFGGNKGISALLAFAVSFLFLFAPDAIAIMKEAIPWFVLGLIAMVFMALLVQSLGVGPDVWSLISAAGRGQEVVSWVIIFSVVVFLFAGSKVLGPKALPITQEGNATITVGQGSVASGSFSQNLGATLFHPKVLGVILILAVFCFAALWIGGGGPGI